MDILSEKLLDLIRCKRELNKSNAFEISFGEIADIWNRDVICRYARETYMTITPMTMVVEEIHDRSFIQDVNIALKNLFDNKIIAKYDAPDEFKIYKPTDVIYLISLKDFNGLQEEKNEKIFDWENCRFSYKGRTYRPSNEEKRKFIKELWKIHREKNKKGKILNAGTRIPEDQLAVKIDLIASIKDFENKIKRARIKRMKKEINRILDSKDIPVHINSGTDGLLLVWTK